MTPAVSTPQFTALARPSRHVPTQAASHCLKHLLQIFKQKVPSVVGSAVSSVSADMLSTANPVSCCTDAPLPFCTVPLDELDELTPVVVPRLLLSALHGTLVHCPAFCVQALQAHI